MAQSNRILHARRTAHHTVKILLFVFLVLLLGTSTAFAADPVAAEEPNFFVQVFQNLFDSQALMRILGQREFVVAAFVVLNLIVFVETGLLIGFFLPGDSLLVTAGLVAS